MRPVRAYRIMKCSAIQLTGLKESFLLATAQGGSAQDCESLIKLGADVNFRGADGETPLLGATRRGHHEAGSVLIVHGADCNAKGRDSLTPLHVAAKEEMPPCLMCFLMHLLIRV